MPDEPYVVVDTNILIRAILRPFGSDRKIYNLFLQGNLKLYSSVILLDELKQVIEEPRIRKKYQVTDDTVNTFISTLLEYGSIIHPKERVALCRDPDDNELLSVATTVADSRNVYLITSDEDLLVLKDKIDKVQIVTPQEFLRIVR